MAGRKRCLLLPTPVMDEKPFTENTKEFSFIYRLEVESRPGILKHISMRYQGGSPLPNIPNLCRHPEEVETVPLFPSETILYRNKTFLVNCMQVNAAKDDQFVI